MSLRDRFLTPRVARAITSPSGILLAGAGASVGILFGAPALAVGLGAAAWAARVAVAVPRAPTREHIDPRSLAQPWRHSVEDALDARERFGKAVARTTSGPIRERLDAIGERVDTGVQECWRIARHGDALVGALRQMDVGDAQRQIAQLGGPGNPTQQRRIEALQAQVDASQRLSALATATQDDLLLLNARLDEAVARAIELSVQVGSVEQLNSLRSDVEGVVGDMESLRQGLEEAERAGGIAGPD